MYLKNRDGMSLIEVMAAFVIIGVITVPLIKMFLAGSVYTTIARKDLTAVFLAQEKLEEVKSKPYNEVNTEELVSHQPIQITNKYDGIFSYKVVVTEDNGQYLKTVAVTIYYKENIQDRQIVLATEKLKR